MKSIRKLGLIIFLAGFSFMLYTLSLNEFSLTKESYNSSILDLSHREILNPVFLELEGKHFDSRIEFIKEFESGVDKINDEFRNNQEWEKVIWTDYTFPIVKNASSGSILNNSVLFFWLTFFVTIFGALVYIFPPAFTSSPGIKNNHIFFSKSKNRGWIGIIIGTVLIAFYIFLYKFPEYIANWVIILDPISIFLSGNPADQWFLYGFIYSLAMTVMGVRMFIKYRHSNYQKIRTVSVVFFQICFAFTIPQILKMLHLPSYDIKSIWPLEYNFFFDYRLNEHLAAGTLGIWMLVWGIALFAIGVPLFTYLYGKRWYCSWVCGCGGLAETAGDPFRQLSDKSTKAWKIERYLIHSVLVFAVVMTTAVLYSYFKEVTEIAGISTYTIRDQYGFFIGFAFAGVVGTGFYPFMGNRVWCRFGCPLAAYLGLVQRFKSRFRITTNGGQCISCGNCSTYCEMGIDVRWYAQRGQNIVRSSCVGCGICAEVCPRGVLKLENGPMEGRINDNPILIGAKKAELNV